METRQKSRFCQRTASGSQWICTLSRTGLDGASNDQVHRVVRCLMGLLSQRMEDISQTEDLTTKLRTLKYDHERMVSMYRKANEQSANSEREMNLHKSRLNAALRTLQSSENANKQTTVELQRTRTALQGVRSAHQTELKKKEKEIERIMEKWQRISDAQIKLSSIPSGLSLANGAVEDGTEFLGQGQGFLEIALEDAEQARASLADENLFLRKLLLKTSNELQKVLHQTRALLPGEDKVEELESFTMTSLFPLSPQNAPADKMASILTSLKNNVTAISEIPFMNATPSKPVAPRLPDGEVERLQGIIASLKVEIARYQQENQDQAAKTQAMFDKFAEDYRISTGEIGEMSVELMSAPLKDEEKERLDVLRKELDVERQQFTNAAIKFGKEKAALEAERMRFLDERRSWEVENMLADLPPTPDADASPPIIAGALRSTPKKLSHKTSYKSPRNSPAKHNVAVGKVGNGRKAQRVSRRLSTTPVKSPPKGVVSYETEVIPPLPAPTFSLLPPSSSLMPNSFVLPPPSPRALLPTAPALPLTQPISPPDFQINSKIETYEEKEGGQQRTTPPSTSPAEPPTTNIVPSTPGAVRRPFPVAKPFAQRMIHAYSPAKPSPLSRILMLTDSPLSPPQVGDNTSPSSAGLQAVAEVTYEDDFGTSDEYDYGGLGGYGYRSGAHNELFPSALEPRIRDPHPQEDQEEMSLAAQLGVSESPPDTPLQERKPLPNAIPDPPPAHAPARVFHPPNANTTGVKKGGYTTAEKGKAKADPPRAGRPSSAMGEKEKENSNTKTSRATSKSSATATGKPSRVSSAAPSGSGTQKSTSGAGTTKASIKAVVKASTQTSSTTARPRMPTKPSVPPAAGAPSTGPRRVLVNSADAPPISKVRKG